MTARRLAALTGLAAAGLVALALAFGAGDQAARLLVSLQHEFQNALGQSLRALRAGEVGAVTGFLGLCFAYGFLHALGPGHGKALIAGYALAGTATLRRMVWIAGLASFAQAAVAVGLIYAGIWAFAGARDRIEGLAARIDPLAMLAIAGLGLLMVWRGLRQLRPVAEPHHHHHEGCGCGHAHAPGPDHVVAASGWREVAALVAGIALRPCTGALFLLLMTWRLGIDGLGILGTFVMAAGTFLITALAALMALGLRRGMRLALPEISTRVFALVTILAGAVILVVGLSAAYRLL